MYKHVGTLELILPVNPFVVSLVVTMGTASSEESDFTRLQELDGIIPRAVYDLFESIEKDKNKSVSVEMSFLEIYNEEARDLLAEQHGGNQSLFIREGSDGEVYVQNLTWKPVPSHSEVAKHMQAASDRRVVASTQMNSVSSRSHAICTLQVTITTLANNGAANETKSKLTLVDLAGSERVKRTKAEGSRLKEGININKGLFVLGQVVSGLSQLGERQSPKSSTPPQHQHIPYRDSKLTRLLQDSLGGNSRTIMVACVSPADSNIEESINTLRYASRARNIQNSAVKNIVDAAMPPEVALALRRENQTLRQRVIQLEAKVRSTLSDADSPKDAISRASMESSSASSDDTIARCLRGQVASLQCKLDHSHEQLTRSAQDALKATLLADQSRLLCEEVVALAKSKGIELESSTNKKSEFPSTGDGGSPLIVEQLRLEIEEWKSREAEARVDAEVARVTAASISSNGGDFAAELFVSPSDDEQEEEIASEQEAQLTSELLTVNGSISQKEEIIKKALVERQCIEAMKSHFEGALQSLQSEVETLSAEREDLYAIVESIPGDSASTIQMKNRINALEKRIGCLQKKADEHKKSLRLREMAEQRVSKLELEIQHDKKRKAELQKKLKEESAERRKDRKEAKLEAARLLKDSNRLKFELQKVKAVSERQAMVLRRKTSELRSKQRLDAEEKIQERVGKAVAATKRIEQQKFEESALMLRLEHSEAMSSLLDSTRMALENEIGKKCSIDPKSAVNIHSSLKEYFQVAGVATESIKSDIQHAKSHRSGMQQAVDQLAKKFISNTEAASTKKKKPSKKKKRKSSIADFAVALDESFIFEDPDDGNDSDWSPDDEKNASKRMGPSTITKVTSTANAESLPLNPNPSTESFDSLKVADLKDRLRDYGLKLSGKKSELKARLKEYISLHQPTQHSHRSQERKPLQSIGNHNVSFMQDNSSFSAKRRDIPNGVVKRTRRRNMNNAVNTAMIEISKL